MEGCTGGVQLPPKGVKGRETAARKAVGGAERTKYAAARRKEEGGRTAPREGGTGGRAAAKKAVGQAERKGVLHNRKGGGRGQTLHTKCNGREGENSSSTEQQ